MVRVKNICASRKLNIVEDIRQNGVAVMTLRELVDDFCLAQGNMREAGYPAQLRHGKWSWKELFRYTLWNIRKAVLNIDCRDHSIHLPKDCERIIAISVVDCYGKLHPLSFNSDWNTAKIRCMKVKCSCDNCGGENTLCAAIDSIKVTTETVVINGQDYTKTTWTRYDGSGAVQVQQKIPAWDVLTSAVVYNTLVETICNVETTTHGCIKATQANMDMLRSNCGCGNFLDQWNAWGYGWGDNRLNRELIPATYNYWGEWNRNAADPTIIHIFGNAIQGAHFGHNASQETQWRGGLRQVILDYQTNGETPETEILIPEYAVEAVQIGMVYRQKYLNPRINEGDKLMAKGAMRAAYRQVLAYLNPVIEEEVAKLQTNRRLW